ncbi:HNH endonuclease [Photobacterium satsumensis]|uniref:HNH endonuclease n=1 Tax=Photobacterium satsumensis TaxID=2910239 RepID=UPI003D14CCDF
MKYEVRKFLTKKDLKEINDAAVREKRNQALTDEFVNGLPDEVKLPVMQTIYHTANEIRLIVILNSKGDIGLIDVSTLRYETLPNVYRYEDGRVEFEDRAITDSKRPYPNGREWKESVVKQPVRKQSTFRAGVLKAYGHQCAMCDINEKSLLRAAHIVDVADGGNDTITNGLCLCVNHEIAYDRGLIGVNDEFEIIFCSDEKLGIKRDKIKLPDNETLYPNREYLRVKFEKLKNA